MREGERQSCLLLSRAAPSPPLAAAQTPAPAAEARQHAVQQEQLLPLRLRRSSSQPYFQGTIRRYSVLATQSFGYNLIGLKFSIHRLKVCPAF